MKKECALQASERWAGLAVLPIVGTGLFYVLPEPLQNRSILQFLPQLSAYCCLVVWASRNPGALIRLGLKGSSPGSGLLWGGATGVMLGWVNTAVLLWGMPNLGKDIEFLRDTPHAHLPPALMLPWLILVIAVLVELNFRGFLLGRLLALGQAKPFGAAQGKLAGAGPALAAALAVATSALVFAFDPFLVATFKHLHWIAVWDGIIWGALWVRMRNLYATIVAHAVEVMILYSILRYALT